MAVRNSVGRRGEPQWPGGGLGRCCWTAGDRFLLPSESYPRTSCSALCPERQLRPDRRRSQWPIAHIVRRLDAFHFRKRPQPRPLGVKRRAHRLQLRFLTEHAAQQQVVDPGPDRSHQTLEARPRQKSSRDAAPTAGTPLSSATSGRGPDASPSWRDSRTTPGSPASDEPNAITGGRRTNTPSPGCGSRCPGRRSSTTLAVSWRPASCDERTGALFRHETPQLALRPTFFRRRLIDVQERLSRQSRISSS